jgi:hypothetical protein
MTLSELLEINKTLVQVNEAVKQANNNLGSKNKTMRLLCSYVEDAQNKMHQAIGEATISGKL